MRYPLVDGQGNFGSIDDDPAAAMRYTEARLTRIAMEMLRDIDQDTVDFGPNYDGSQPGAAGAAGPLPEPAGQRLVGHRGRHGDEHPAAQPRARSSTRRSPSSTTRTITIDELMEHIKGPDFPTGGIILGTQGIRDAYETGRGKVRVRARVAHRGDRPGQGGDRSSPSCPTRSRRAATAALITKIADLVNDKKIPEISDLRDESDRRGMRLVIELKRGVIAKVVLNKLYKHTSLQTTFGVNMRRARRRRPASTLSLREVLHAYVAHQREVDHPPHEVRAGPEGGARPRPRGPADRDRQPRRGHRDHPRLARPRDGPRAAGRAVRAVDHPGLGDPRPAPVAAHRAGVRRDQARARRPRGAHP